MVTNAARGPKKSHSVRIYDLSWAKARKRAGVEGTTINGVVEEILEGYSQGLVSLPAEPLSVPKGRPAKTSRSVRVHDSIWAKSRRVAAENGTTVNNVIERIVESYARGLINLPKVTKTYS